MYLLLLLLVMLLSYSYGRREANSDWLDAAENGLPRFYRKTYYEVKEVGK